MKLLLLVVICVLINVISKYVYKLIEEYRNIKKVKNEVNKIDYNQILKNLDKDLYSDFNVDDIDNEK